MPTRFELIDHRKNDQNNPTFGRMLVIRGDKEFVVDISYQDDGRTVKIFLSDIK